VARSPQAAAGVGQDRQAQPCNDRTTHIVELRKRASEADAKLKRLYDAIENGIADLADPMLKDRIAELKAIRDQAPADAERAEVARLIRSALVRRLGPLLSALRLALENPFARRQDLDLVGRGGHATQRQRGDGGDLLNVSRAHD